MGRPEYDVLIVGAGITGTALAHALPTLPRPLHIALERFLSKPGHIVGELLQPSGIIQLKQLGIEPCLDNIGAIPVYRYCVAENGKSVRIPYPGRHEGRSFHHGRFVMALRDAVRRAENVDIIEATATKLIKCESSRRVIGVRAASRRGT